MPATEIAPASGDLPAHAAVLLAAGASLRLGRSKQLLVVEGEALVRRAAQALLATAPAVAIVVLGAEATAVRAALHGLPLEFATCVDWQRGMGASLRTGIAAVSGRCAGALVAVCDQPAMDAVHLVALVREWQRDPGRAVASGYAGVAGVPAVLPSQWFRELQRLDGDAGARSLLRTAVDTKVLPAPALAQDIDLPGQLGA